MTVPLSTPTLSSIEERKVKKLDWVYGIFVLSFFFCLQMLLREYLVVKMFMMKKKPCPGFMFMVSQKLKIQNLTFMRYALLFFDIVQTKYT